MITINRSILLHTKNCSELFKYPLEQKEHLKFTHTSIPAMNIFSMLINLSAGSFILYHKSVRWKNFGTLKLFVFNFGECFFTSYEIKQKGLSNIGRSSYFAPIITFFLVGQTMAIALVTVERMQIVSGTMTSVNTMIRNPKDDRNKKKLMLLVICLVLVNALLSGLIYRPQYILAPLVLLIIILYIILVCKVAKLQTVVQGTVNNLRRKTLVYVSTLFVGFICEFTVFFIQGVFFREQMINQCPLVLTIQAMFVMYLFSLRFIWEPVSYFLFNSVPRELFITAWKTLIENMTCCKAEINKHQPVRQLALVPFTLEQATISPTVPTSYCAGESLCKVQVCKHLQSSVDPIAPNLPHLCEVRLSC